MPSQAFRTSRTLSDEAVELASYRVEEKVRDTMVRRLTFALSVSSVLLTLAGYFGFSALKSNITRQVENDVSATIDKETKQVSERVRNDLTDVEVSSRAMKKAAADAQNQADLASASVSRIQEMSARYTKLNEEFDSVNKRLTAASNQALQDINNLRRAQLDAAAGRPSVVSWEFNPKKGATSVIQGANFGESTGKISVRVAYRQPLTIDMTYLPPLNFTGWIAVDGASIAKWSNTMIVLKFSDEFLARYKMEIEKLHVGNAADAKPEIANYRIDATSGLSNEIR